MKKKLLITFSLFTVLFSTLFAQAEDATITKLFQDGYFTLKSMRQSNGIYLDALAINIGDKPAAIAANGVGLVSLCIADSMYKKTNDAINWESKGDSLVLKTLQTFIGFKKSGKTNSKGLFPRYFIPTDGSSTWGLEYSTIDNAIFAMGMNFCKNYFSNDTAIVNNANRLLNTMDFTAAVSSDGQQLYMVLDQYGNVSAPVGAFNEYMILAWLAKNVGASNPGYTKSQTYWNKYYENPTTSSVYHPTYAGIQVLSDGNGFMSDFIPEFCYYLCNHFKNNTNYMTYFRNSRTTDSLFFKNSYSGINSYEWGLGAGEDPGGGYTANSIYNNNLAVVSPHVIAGFLPIHPQSKNDLKSLYNNGNGPAVYSLPNNQTRKVLWRYSRQNTATRCSYIQAIDFSTFVYGLATLPEYIGDNFFDKYNKLDKNIATITGIKEGTFCTSGSVKLGASASAGIINWYSSPTGGVSLATGTSFTTPLLTATTVYYVDATYNSCTTEKRTAVTAKEICTSEINTINFANLFKVYPNPTTGKFKVAFNEQIETNNQIEIYNNLGVLIQEISISKHGSVTQIDLTTYPKGIYLVKISTSNRIFVNKVFKK